MGCDIHIFVEYKKPGGKWEPDKEHAITVHEEGTEDEHVVFKEMPYGGRNYHFFYALSGVRYGPVGPITGTSGVPDDSCDLIKKAVEYWDSDGHSHTYFTLEEYEAVLKNLHEVYLKEEPDYKSDEGWLSDNKWANLAKHCRDVMEQMQADAIILNAPELAYEECRIVVFYDC